MMKNHGEFGIERKSNIHKGFSKLSPSNSENVEKHEEI